MHKETFKLVDALEETINFLKLDMDMFRMPVSNTYIPVKNTIMKKPNMLDEDVESDELGYRFFDYSKKDKTRQRIGPTDQLNPLQGNRMGPG